MDHQSSETTSIKYSNIYSFINLSIFISFINFKPRDHFPGHFSCQNINLAKMAVNNYLKSIHLWLSKKKIEKKEVNEKCLAEDRFMKRYRKK